MACRSSQDLTPSSSDVSWLVHVHDHDAPFCVGRRAGQISSDKTSQKVDNHRRNIHPSFRHMRPKRSTAGQSLPTRGTPSKPCNSASKAAARGFQVQQPSRGGVLGFLVPGRCARLGQPSVKATRRHPFLLYPLLSEQFTGRRRGGFISMLSR